MKYIYNIITRYKLRLLVQFASQDGRPHQSYAQQTEKNSNDKVQKHA